MFYCYLIVALPLKRAPTPKAPSCLSHNALPWVSLSQSPGDRGGLGCLRPGPTTSVTLAVPASLWALVFSSILTFLSAPM